MKMRAGFIFFFLILILATGYICAHLWQLTPGSRHWKILVVSLFGAGFLAIFGGLFVHCALDLPERIKEPLSCYSRAEQE